MHLVTGINFLVHGFTYFQGKGIEKKVNMECKPQSESMQFLDDQMDGCKYIKAKSQCKTRYLRRVTIWQLLMQFKTSCGVIYLKKNEYKKDLTSKYR